MDPLTLALLNRQRPQEQQPLPVQPPTSPTKVPPKAQRFATAQAMQDAYRSGWATNPVLLRAQLGSH